MEPKTVSSIKKIRTNKGHLNKGFIYTSQIKPNENLIQEFVAQG